MKISVLLTIISFSVFSQLLAQEIPEPEFSLTPYYLKDNTLQPFEKISFTKNELPPIGAPEFSYYLNYNGLDRYNREGITFLFDRTTKKFSYNGAAWREILKRYPNSPEAAEARKHLEALQRGAK